MQFLAIVLLCIVSLVLFIMVLKLNRKLENRSLELASTQYRLLKQQLYVPYEAIFYDHATQEQICKIRAETYARQGVMDINLCNDRNLYNVVPTGATAGTLFESQDDWMEVANSSFENLWLNQAGDACRHVVRKITHRDRLREYLINHPNSRKRLTKLLSRIEKSPNKQLSAAASNSIRELRNILNEKDR